MPTVHAIARAADKRKAGDITALRVSHLTVTTEFFVNMVGNSRPQNQAIAAAVEEELKALGRTARHEGTADSGCVRTERTHECLGSTDTGLLSSRSTSFPVLSTYSLCLAHSPSSLLLPRSVLRNPDAISAIISSHR